MRLFVGPFHCARTLVKLLAEERRLADRHLHAMQELPPTVPPTFEYRSHNAQYLTHRAAQKAYETAILEQGLTNIAKELCARCASYLHDGKYPREEGDICWVCADAEPEEEAS